MKNFGSSFLRTGRSIAKAMPSTPIFHLFVVNKTEVYGIVCQKLHQRLTKTDTEAHPRLFRESWR